MTGMGKSETSRIMWNTSIHGAYFCGLSVGLHPTDGVRRMYYSELIPSSLYKKISSLKMKEVSFFLTPVIL